MADRHPALDLAADLGTLTAALCDIESVSGHEGPLADAIEAALAPHAHLHVDRIGDAVVARTRLRRPERVVLAGHIDTVPVAANLPTWRQEDLLFGRGTCDMKSGVAIQLKLAAELTKPTRDVTYVFYDNEEVEADKNGLGRLARGYPEWLMADFAVLLEPSGGTVEGGCNGTMRVDVTVRGKAAHSARAWRGRNAIHAAAPVLMRLRACEPAEVEVDGLVYREGVNAVGIQGGIASNVIPDQCRVSVNYRFAPSKSVEQAAALMEELFKGLEIEVVDVAPGARPGLTHPVAAAFVAAIGKPPRPKYGWTDVARFSELGVPAVNFGPADPELAHTDAEYVSIRAIHECEAALRTWLTC